MPGQLTGHIELREGCEASDAGVYLLQVILRESEDLQEHQALEIRQVREGIVGQV